ncbi:zf-HC2 domain-containing protein [candidate division KSB1 bacterium]|nr:zf-HC2 domain-containing protein [candidate division KSB1 bacterium]
MKCNQVKKRLSAYLDGELTAAEAEKVSDHLNRCVGCRRAAEQLRRAYQRLDAGDALPADSFFLTRFRARLSDLGQSNARPYWQQWLQRAVIPATLAVGLFLGMQLGIHLQQNWSGAQSSGNTYIESQLLSDMQQNSLTAQYLALNGWTEGDDEE